MGRVIDAKIGKMAETESKHNDETETKLYVKVLPTQWPIVYGHEYNIGFLGLERLHPFDAGKWGKVYGFLKEAGMIRDDTIVKPVEATENDLLKVHTKGYINSLRLTSIVEGTVLKEWSMNVAGITEVPPVALLPNFIVQRKVLRPFRYQTGGTILAAKLAVDRGWGINIGGGFHHCSSERGGGFCAYADITLAVRFLFSHHPEIKKAMIVDLDAHQGNGHERDFMNDESVYIMDVFNRGIYPHDGFAKRAIKKKVELTHGTADEEYLDKVEKFGWARIEGLPKDCLWPVEVKEKVGRKWRVYVSSDDECYGNPQKEEIGRYSGMFLKRFGICRRNSLQNYASRRNDLSDLDESVADDLTVVEQQLLKNQELMTVRGKGGRPVPIIIPPEAVSPLSYIASSHVREAAGVPPGNNYLFPNSVDRYVRVYQTLQSFCNKLQLKAPGRITSVALRKYTATLSQMMNLDKYQMDWVCKHLGHTKSVHREAYRQMSGLVERVYITKLMLVQDNNLSGKYKGADLHKIDVKDLVFPQDADTEVEDVAVEGDVAVEESLNDEINLDSALNEFTPDVIVYNAGTDILDGDPLGNLSITSQGIIDRDEIVFRKASEKMIPIVMVTSGGYQRSTAQIIANSILNLRKKGLIKCAEAENCPAPTSGCLGKVKVSKKPE